MSGKWREEKELGKKRIEKKGYRGVIRERQKKFSESEMNNHWPTFSDSVNPISDFL